MAPAVNMAELTSHPDAMLPDSGMRMLGAVQITLGLLVFILGVVDLVLTMTSHNTGLDSYGSHYGTVVTMTAVASPLWAGLWKVALIVTSLLCCALFGPACAVINGFISYRRHNLAKGDYQWLISLVVCFLAILEVVMATVAASVTCCCSTFRSTQVHVFVNPRKLSSSGSDLSIATTSSTVSGKLDKNLSRVAVSGFSTKNSSYGINPTNPRIRPPAPVTIPREFKDGWTQVANVSTRSANVGTSENNFVQKFSQAPVTDTNDISQNPNIQMVNDGVQQSPQTSLAPASIADEDGSLPHPRQTLVKSLGEHHLSQRSNRSPVQEVIMRTPRHWVSRSPGINPNNGSLHQHLEETPVKNVQPHRSSTQRPSSSTMNARGSPLTQRMSWTPDRHLRNQRPRPSSTEEILRDLEHTASFTALKKWTLPQ